jgi:hypothetical protein
MSLNDNLTLSSWSHVVFLKNKSSIKTVLYFINISCLHANIVKSTLMNTHYKCMYHFGTEPYV